jgi:hypothetical protein
MAQAYFDQFKMALDTEDVARTILFAIQQPRHVQLAQLVVLPVNRCERRACAAYDLRAFELPASAATRPLTGGSGCNLLLP